MSSSGDRCALAIVGPGIDTTNVARGDVVLDPSLHHPVSRIDVQLRLLASERKSLSQWLPVKFHHGSAERDARLLVLRDEALKPGETDFAQIVLESPMALAAGDRFVVRDAAASRTMGGGVILDLVPPERKRTTPERRAELRVLQGEDPLQVLDALLGVRGFVDLGAFFRDRALSRDGIGAAAKAFQLVIFEIGAQVLGMQAARWEQFVTEVAKTLDAFHAASPDLPGLGQERLRLQTTPRFPAAAFSVVLKKLVNDGHVVLDRSWIKRPGHIVTFSDDEERIWSRMLPLLGGTERYRPPRVRDIANAQGIDEQFVRRLFKMGARRGDVEEVAKDHFFQADAVIEMADAARALATESKNSEFTVIDFRNRLDNGRKVAIQILEFFDRQGFTMRRGDARKINPHKRDLFSRSTLAPAAAVRDGGETSPVGRPDFKSGEGRETVLGGFDSCLLRQPNAGER